MKKVAVRLSLIFLFSGLCRSAPVFEDRGHFFSPGILSQVHPPQREIRERFGIDVNVITEMNEGEIKKRGWPSVTNGISIALIRDSNTLAILLDPSLASKNLFYRWDREYLSQIFQYHISLSEFDTALINALTVISQTLACNQALAMGGVCPQTLFETGMLASDPDKRKPIFGKVSSNIRLAMISLWLLVTLLGLIYWIGGFRARKFAESC